MLNFALDFNLILMKMRKEVMLYFDLNGKGYNFFVQAWRDRTREGQDGGQLHPNLCGKLFAFN